MSEEERKELEAKRAELFLHMQSALLGGRMDHSVKDAKKIIKIRKQLDNGQQAQKVETPLDT